jgi:hypothetical protein
MLHFINEKNITYMCMCDNNLSEDSAKSFLLEIKSLFLETFTQREIYGLTDNSLDTRFKDTLKGKMSYYNSNLNDSDSISKMKKAVNDFKDIVLETEQQLMERDQKLNLIGPKVENLRSESKVYYSGVNN